MQNTFLEKNPFYLLEILPSDKRETIISKAEEKAFFANGNEYEEAQASLITPTRRLTAELEWFFDVSATDYTQIINSVKNNKEICTDKLSGISRVNAALYNLLVANFEDYLEIGYAILEIDELFNEIDSLEICDIINKYRADAGIVLATKADIDSAFGKKRDTIRQLISERLETLSESDYIELVSIIAEKYIAEVAYNDGVVINDIVNQYEIRMKSVIDLKVDTALSMIEKVDINTNKPIIDLTIKKLIDLLKEFDRCAKPLQVKCAVEGFEHKQSLYLAQKCREFAIELYNEYENIDASFKLIQTLGKVFSELTEFCEIISSDEKQITKIRKKKDEFKKKLEENRQANKLYTISVQGNRFTIPPFCTCCMKHTSNKETVSFSMPAHNGNTKTTHTIAVDLPICDACIKHRSKFNLLLVFICSISIIVGSVCMAVLILAEVSGFLSFLLGACATIGAYFGISAIWKTAPLTGEHARRGKSAHICTLFMSNNVSRQLSYSSSVWFTFYNWEYAYLFYEANKDVASDVKETTALNTAKSTSVLKANEHPVVNMFKMIGVFVVVAIIMGTIFGIYNSVTR